MTLRYEIRFPSGPNGERLPSYAVLAGCDIEGDAEARASALDALGGFLTPAPVSALEDWLAELSVITARRARDEMTEALTLTAYASRLQDYPADVVRHALLVRTWHFWPTWAELKTVCDELVAPRNAMLAALRRPVAIVDLKQRVPPSPEAAARIQALIDRFKTGLRDEPHA